MTVSLTYEPGRAALAARAEVVEELRALAERVLELPALDTHYDQPALHFLERRLFERTDVIAIGEPLVRAMAGLPPLEGGCGVSTVRVTPRATTQPCVYWPGSGEPLSHLVSAGAEIVNSAPFERARTLPEACQTCEFRDACHGGCAGRRRLQGALSQPDFYCPIIRRERPRLEIRMAANRDLPKLGSSCTTIVIARESES